MLNRPQITLPYIIEFEKVPSPTQTFSKMGNLSSEFASTPLWKDGVKSYQSLSLMSLKGNLKPIPREPFYSSQACLGALCAPNAPIRLRWYSDLLNLNIKKGINSNRCEAICWSQHLAPPRIGIGNLSRSFHNKWRPERCPSLPLLCKDSRW